MCMLERRRSSMDVDRWRTGAGPLIAKDTAPRSRSTVVRGMYTTSFFRPWVVVHVPVVVIIVVVMVVVMVMVIMVVIRRRRLIGRTSEARLAQTTPRVLVARLIDECPSIVPRSSSSVLPILGSSILLLVVIPTAILDPGGLSTSGAYAGVWVHRAAATSVPSSAAIHRGVVLITLGYAGPV